jgi:hypothetical protein
MGLPPISRDLGLPSNIDVPGHRRGHSVEGVSKLDRVDHVGDSSEERNSGGNAGQHEHPSDDDASEEHAMFDELA